MSARPGITIFALNNTKPSLCTSGPDYDPSMRELLQTMPDDWREQWTKDEQQEEC